MRRAAEVGTHVCSVAFYAVAYVPFCMSLLLHSALTCMTAQRPVDPAEWTLSSMRPYWYAALACYVAGVTYSVAIPLTFHGVGLLWIWPLLGGSVVFHLLTIGYVLQRPELCELAQRNASFRVWRWRNWISCGAVVAEFMQLVSFSLSGSGLFDGHEASVANAVLRVLLRFLFVFESDRLLFAWCTAAVALFALLVGEVVHSRRSPTSPLGTLLYEGLGGVLYLPVLAGLLKLAKIASDPFCQATVLLGHLYFSTPAIFVSIYRADQRRFSSDVNYSPLVLVRERVAKELWAIFVIDGSASTTAHLIAVIVLGTLLLINLGDASQSPCVAVVRVRRALLVLAVWSAVCALLVLEGAKSAGRLLLLIGGAVIFSTIAIAMILSAFAPCMDVSVTGCAMDAERSGHMGEALCNEGDREVEDEARPALLAPRLDERGPTSGVAGSATVRKVLEPGCDSCQ